MSYPRGMIQRMSDAEPSEGAHLTPDDDPADVGVRIKPDAAALAELRAQLGSGPSLVDELIAERRAEARREDA